MGTLTAQSRIVRVEVFARGARVTREVSAGVADGQVELEVPGVSALAEPGSLRGTPTGGWEVLALRTRLDVPAAPSAPGEPIARLRELARREEAIAEELHALGERLQLVRKLQPKPSLMDTKATRFVDPAARARDALAVSALASTLASDLETRLLALEAERDEVARAREAAELAAAQASSAELAGAGRPTRTALVRLGRTGGAAPIALELSYVVPAARWWPAYAARFSDGGTRVQLALDAFVAQASGEDWTGARLQLSTADLVRDARLPELPSLRLGRAQPAPKRGYREPPADLDALFAGWDAARAEQATLERPEPPRRPKGAPRRRTRELDKTRAEAWGAAMPVDAVVGEAQAMPDMPPPRSAPAPQNAFAGAAPAAYMMDEATMITLGGGGAMTPEPQPIPSALEPGDAWLDFDSLVLASADDPTHRGRLIRGGDDDGGAGAALAQMEGCAPPPHAIDPATTRGQFDHRYSAAAATDVPSDGRPHRVSLMRKDGAPTLKLRAVPREAPEVYREAEIKNPFDAPLLDGPVDIFFDDALMTVTPLSRVDRGGTLSLGLGVEERVRVVRNARAEESTAGVFGGSTVVEHAITIELRSALGRAIAVEVLDRIPVVDGTNGAVEVSLADAQPSKPEAYDQRERGEPVRGGLRWRVELPPAGEARVAFRYRVKLPAKLELVGGNRRE